MSLQRRELGQVRRAQLDIHDVVALVRVDRWIDAVGDASQLPRVAEHALGVHKASASSKSAPGVRIVTASV